MNVMFDIATGGNENGGDSESGGDYTQADKAADDRQEEVDNDIADASEKVEGFMAGAIDEYSQQRQVHECVPEKTSYQVGIEAKPYLSRDTRFEKLFKTECEQTGNVLYRGDGLSALGKTGLHFHGILYYMTSSWSIWVIHAMSLPVDIISILQKYQFHMPVRVVSSGAFDSRFHPPHLLPLFVTNLESPFATTVARCLSIRGKCSTLCSS